MKKMKKALALSLALVMSATLFGCAPKENPAANSPTASDPAASTQSSQSGEERQDHDEIVIKLGASSASTEPTVLLGRSLLIWSMRDWLVGSGWSTIPASSWVLQWKR